MPKILVFGGNGFIGAEVVDYLLNNNKNYEFILLNRGNWSDWDSFERIKPRIHENIIFDRKKDSIKKCLKKYLEEDSFKFEAVIDFSGYKSRDIKSVIDQIPPKKIKLYIYISTDSIYEVCIDENANNESGVLYENDSIRPESKEKQKILKEFDSYGHHKLKCEELLINQSKNDESFPFICLRLPDVFGPRDSLDRWWFYQMWLQYLFYANPTGQIEIPIPKFFFNKKTSYVYVKDVARIIDLILKLDIKNEIFNIGFEESFSLKDIIEIIASFLNPNPDVQKKLNFIVVEDCYFNHPYPSVTKGSISINKIKSKLNFEPYPLDRAINETIKFFNEAYTKYPNRRKNIEKEIKKEILKNENDELKFDEFIENLIKNNYNA